MIRFFDLLFSLLGLLICSPILLIIAVVVKISSEGPIFYRQERVGKLGKEFKIFKFRTMKLNSDKNGLITIGSKDFRVTYVGYYLRRVKLDELPQLINVLLGEMSMVGPRPEVRKYVDLYSEDQKKVLRIKPGITDWASIYYQNENVILGQSLDPEKDYVEKIMPDKIKYNLIYIDNYEVYEYLKIIIYTIWNIIKQSHK